MVLLLYVKTGKLSGGVNTGIIIAADFYIFSQRITCFKNGCSPHFIN